MSPMPLAIVMASRPQPSQSMLRLKQAPKARAEAGPDGNLMRTLKKRPIVPAVLPPRRKRKPWKRDSRVLLKKSRKKPERERRQKMQQLGLVLVALTTQKRRRNQRRKRTMIMRLKRPEDFPRERRKSMKEGQEQMNPYHQNCVAQELQLKKESITKKEVKVKSITKKKRAIRKKQVKEVLQDHQDHQEQEDQEEHQQEKADMKVMTTEQEVVITPKQSQLAVLMRWRTPHPGRAHNKVPATSWLRTSTKLT